MKDLKYIEIPNFTTESGFQITLNLSYETFGRPLHQAPIVLVNHALTGNSNVAGDNGWWQDLIGDGRAIDTQKFTVLAFNIPGNGYDGFTIENYKDFVARDVARIFLQGLESLKIENLFALIGGSLGGGIAWEMAFLSPLLAEHLIVVATDWKSTDWLIANCQIQEQFLVNSNNPVHDARMHAMLCYRTPQSFKERFQRSINDELEIFNVESWLLHHGKKLQERFQLSAYKLMNQLLKTIDVTKGRGNNVKVLEMIKSSITIVGVDSDLFFTAEENRETQRLLAQSHANVTYSEIHSKHGHDAFLIEFEQLEKIVEPIFNQKASTSRLKVLKFGGKSLANGEGFERVLSIIEEKVTKGDNIMVVASARGKATDQLEELLEKATKGNYESAFKAFQLYQTEPLTTLDFSSEFSELQNIFEGVKLLGDYSEKIKAQVLAFGEWLSVKTLATVLQSRGIQSQAVDSRKLIVTDNNYLNAQPKNSVSREQTVTLFKDLDKGVLPVVTGFIGANLQGETTLLGRNGSNYSAALFANYLDAEELQNYTHVNGIYTANPDIVEEAQKIRELSYNEANELANFGASVLHSKTIVPLVEKNINLHILNTFNPEDEGTLITSKSSSKSVTSLSVLEDVALINLEGRGLLGKVGVDARIFKALTNYGISVSLVSQGSSERGIGLVIKSSEATQAVLALEQEFQQDFYSRDVSKIGVIDDVAVISIIGIALSDFHKPFNALIKNQITPLLFSNTVTGKNVSLVVKKSQSNKAVNVIHGEVFGISKKVNIAIFGHGLVGGTLINQILKSKPEIERRKSVNLNIFAIGNSKKVALNKRGIGEDWKAAVSEGLDNYTVEDVIAFAKAHHLENLIAVDNTASPTFHNSYIPLAEAGFDLVSSNKIANTISHEFYSTLREKLKAQNKEYLYETTVGAGLPLIDTIKLLHESGENITRIRGVFSGTLSYLFNHFSAEEKTFSAIVRDAVSKGYTEPDPREDFSGNDVARKLLILARELDLINEFEDVSVQNLIPEAYQKISVADFLGRLEELDKPFQEIKEQQAANHVLRYVGDLSGDLQQEKGNLEVKLISVPIDSSLGQVKGADAIIEIFTESYGEQPIVIQGAGAGAKVTARGVFGDILRLSKQIN